MAAAEALIVLSLLGCDDSGAQCDFVRVGPERYETVEACRAASEPLLAASAEENYPTVVAVCSPESSVPTAQVAGSGEPVPVPVPPETPAEVDGNAMTPAETAEAPSIQELLTVDGFDYDKVVDYIDNSELGELKKASAKAALEAVRDTPEITQAALDQIKVLLGLEE